MLKSHPSPCSAFEAAAQCLRAHFAPMMTETAEMMQMMREAVRVDNVWTIQQNETPYSGDWLQSGPYQAFGKPVTTWDGITFNKRALSEKLLCDLNYDIGLPSATCAFQRITRPNTATTAERLVSVVPFQTAVTADKVTKDTVAGLQTFLETHPQLVPAFMAQTVVDIWFGNKDRYPRNLVIDSTEAPSRMFGIDLGLNRFTTNHAETELSILAQNDVFCALLHEDHAPHLQTTLTAIETMPKEHIHQTTARLTPLSGSGWDANAITNVLVWRQKNVRHALRDALGSRKMDQLGLA